MMYIFMSTVVFLGFAQSFHLGFSSSNEGFQSMQESLMSMVRFTSGDVNYDALQRANTVLAPVLYTMALFVLAFVWTSLLLAIVLNAYYIEVSDVRFPLRPPLRLPLASRPLTCVASCGHFDRVALTASGHVAAAPVSRRALHI